MKKIFRKIHLWLSVPFGLFITLICLSGATLVFEKEITELCRRDIYFVREIKDNPFPMDHLLQRVSDTLPDSVSVTGVTVSPDAARTWQVSLSKPRRASLYVDPYTGEVTGRAERLPFFHTMFRLHRWMLGSSTGFGKLLVGVSTLLLVVILLTGILMWLTNKHRPLRKSLTISLGKGLPRFWHDLHVTGGIYATLFLLVLALTGLTWSFSWYRTGFYRLFGAAASTEQAAEPDVRTHDKRADEQGAHTHGKRADEQGARTHDKRADEQGAHTHGDGHAHRPFAHWQQVLDELSDAHPGYRQITLSEGSASVVPSGRISLRAADRFEFDKRSGAIVRHIPYADQGRDAHVRSAVYCAHVGSWGGWITRLLTFLSALLGATLPLTGYYLWFKRLLGRSGHAHPHP